MSLPPTNSTHDPLRTVDAVSRLLDSQFKIPGTEVRFGLDAIAGLVPFGGDAAGFVASGALILTMARHGASPLLVARMLINVALDATVGAVPILGTVFDVVYKANNRNVRLLREHYEEGKYNGSVWSVVVGTLLVLIAIGVLLFYVLWQLAAWLWDLL